MDALLADIRHALRSLLKSPGFALAAVLTLALGIGANAAIFSVVNVALLRPLPYVDANRLVRLYATMQGERWAVSPPDFQDWRRAGIDSHTLSDAAAISEGTLTITGEGDAEPLPVAYTTAGFFRTMGLAPQLGRGFTDADAVPGQEHEVVLADGVWRRRFGARLDVVGTSIRLDDQSYIVIGVMPPGFDFPRGSDLWVSLAFTPNDLATQRGAHYLGVIARLTRGVTLEREQSEISTLAGRLATQYPSTNAGHGAVVLSLRDAQVGDVRRGLLILFGAVGLVLLIACVNVANLLLARAVARERDLAIRVAMGARRADLMRHVLAESLVLGIAGGGAGLLLAVWTTHGLAALRPAALARFGPIGVDPTVLLFTGGLALLTSVAFGVIPALHAAQVVGLQDTLQGGTRNVAGGRDAHRARSALVVTELALAVMLLAGAGLLIKSFARLRAVDPGFTPGGALTFHISLPDARYHDPSRAGAFYADLLDQIEALPGVEAAAATSGLPLEANYQISVSYLDGRQLSDDESNRLKSPQIRVVTPGYFRVMGMAISRGQALTAEDRAGAPPVTVVNEAAARELWPGLDPTGHHVTIGTHLGLGKDWPRVGGTVVGVARDVKDDDLASPARPTLYVTHAQFPIEEMDVVARAAPGVDPMTFVLPIRAALRAADPEVPMYRARPLATLVDDAVAQPRFSVFLLGTFAGVALLLAGVGIFGVLAYVVAQRTREIGIRMALGAGVAQVVSETVGRALRPVLLGMAVGLVGALLLTRVMRNLLYEVRPTDPSTFALVVVILLLVAVAAAYVPARRAARVDPMGALRCE